MQYILALLLTLFPTSEGLTFTVTTDTAAHFYAQVDSTPGLAASPQIFEFDLAPGETFAHAINVSLRPGLHLSPESVRVRVWSSEGGEGPAADESLALAAPPPLHYYVPLIR